MDKSWRSARWLVVGCAAWSLAVGLVFAEPVDADPPVADSPDPAAVASEVDRLARVLGMPVDSSPRRGGMNSTGYRGRGGLIIWMGEFGRTPKINARTGRDHFPRAFNVALAGGGVKGGQAIGSTSADGTEVRDRPVTVPDLFCSIVHRLGIDARAENESALGRPIKIVEGGDVVSELSS